jgi:hypothetical protein
MAKLKQYTKRKQLRVKTVAEGAPRTSWSQSGHAGREISIALPDVHNDDGSTRSFTLWMNADEARRLCTAIFQAERDWSKWEAEAAQRKGK